ncbi:MAG TPA: ATP-binding protein [Burkholderiales bacterium]
MSSPMLDSLRGWFHPDRWQQSPAAGYTLAIAFTILALWSRSWFQPYIGSNVPFSTFFAAVALTAWFGGYGPCILAVILGALCSWYFVLEPVNAFKILRHHQLMGLSVFVLTGFIIAAFSGRMRQALDAMYLAKLESEGRAIDAQRSQQILDTLLENVPEGITMAGGPPEYRIVAQSRFAQMAIGPAADRLIGIPAGEHAAGAGLLMADGAVPKKEQVPLYRATRHGESIHNESWAMRRGDGTLMHILVTTVPVRDSGGTIIGGIGCWRDVTNEKLAEQERQRLLDSERAARLEAERNARVKDEFLATLSHELRTPLNAIVGWMHILKARPPTEDVIRQAVAAIERNSRAQMQLIEDLLDMSRIVSGKFRLEVQTLDLVPLIRAAIESLQPAADAKEIRLQSVLDSDPGPIKGDPNRLQQVVWNLLSNAVKFTPKGGRIQIHLERVGSHVELSVSDSGVGMSAEFLPHVFERFRQQDGSTTRSQGGLGLGLAIVKQLVEHHGGAVEARSAGPGLGSTFVVKLPVAMAGVRVAEAESSPIADIADISLEGMLILAVDDDADSCAVLRRILEERHARVEIASSAGEALEKLQRIQPDLIISDIGMPERDGYAFVSDVRESLDPRLRQVPIVALTAFARPEDRIRALQSGYNMHVTKPVNPLELLTVITRVRRSV